jgi:mannose-6-phosphate isomerase-like protein (cupin superfamily)
MTGDRPSAAHGLADLITRRETGGSPYLEFLRSRSLSAGLYVLAAGAVDAQSPHAEDEVYVVLDGRARFTAGDATQTVEAGDTLFVAAGVPHRFHDIEAELRLIVVFAPPEGSSAG